MTADWTATRTWSAAGAGDLLSESRANAYLRDNLDHLDEQATRRLTNVGGNGALVAGDVVVYATTGQVLTTTTAVDPRKVVVALDSIADSAQGRFRGVGFCLVNVTGSVAFGDYLVTSTTAKKARTAVGAEKEAAFGRAYSPDSSGQVLALIWTNQRPQPPMMVLYSTANQSIPDSTDTPLLFNTDDTDTDAQHFTVNNNLTGTVAKTNGAATLTGTGTLFSSELSVGQIIDVPGGAVERRVVTIVASNTSATVSGNFANSASGQTAARVSSAFAFRTPGLYLLTGVCAFAANATGTRRAGFQVNRTLPSAVIFAPAEVANLGASKRVYLPVPAVYVRASQWDFAELVAWQDSSGSLNADGSTTAGSLVPYVTAQWVSA